MRPSDQPLSPRRARGSSPRRDGDLDHLPASDRDDDRGEGVISAAIVVLIFAILGAAMWVVFNQVFTDVTNDTRNQNQQHRRLSDRGAGQLSGVIGATVVLALLLVGLHVTLALRTLALTDAVAHDAARLVAEADDPGRGIARAQALVAGRAPRRLASRSASSTVRSSPPWRPTRRRSPRSCCRSRSSVRFGCRGEESIDGP